MWRPLKLGTAILLLVSLLGVSTALITEVREQITTAPPEDPKERSGEQARSRSSGLPLSGMTLLQDTPAEMPERTQRAGVVDVEGPGALILDEGDRIRPSPTPITQIGWLITGSQATLTETGIACAACNLELGNRTIPLPPNTTIQPSPEAPELAPSDVGEGERVRVTPGAVIELPALTMRTERSFELAAGARAILPGEDPVQLPPPDQAPTVTLPEGTTVRASSNTSTSARDLANALADQPGTRGPIQAEPETPIRPTIEITDVPDTIEKGQTFQVRGLITYNQTPLTRHPVTVFANATKNQPGFEITTEPTATSENGRFVATAEIDTSRPTRPYHIVARADAKPQANPPTREAWTDPVVVVNGTANLELDLPDEVGKRTPTPLEASLVDEYDAPIPDQRIVFYVPETNERIVTRTNERGHAVAILETGFPRTGEHTVSARFPGSEGLEAVQEAGRLTVVDARILTHPTQTTTRGSNVTIQGEVLENGQPPEPQRIEASYADISVRNATDENGTFRLEVPVPETVAVGDHRIEVHAPAIDAKQRVLLSVTAPVELSVDTRPVHPAGGTFNLPVTALDDRSNPVKGLELQARSEDQLIARDFTDGNGQATVPVSLPETGQRVVNLSTPGTATHAPASRQVTLPTAPLTVESDIEIPIGEAANGTATLRIGDAPLIGEPVRLTGSGFHAEDSTDATGTAKLSLEAVGLPSPGRYPVDLSLPRYEISQRVTATVIDSPTLDATVVNPGEDGAPIRVRVDVTGHAGPLGGIPVKATVHGPFSSSAREITEPNGTALVTLDRPSDAEGTVAITVKAQGTQDSASARTTASAHVTPSPFPWGWVLLGAAIPLAAIAGVLVHRRRQDDPARPQPTPTRSRGPHLALRIPPQGDDLPPVWHEDEPTALELRIVDEFGDPVPNTRVTVEGPPGKREVTVDANGYARIRLPAHEPGTHAYEARYDGDEGHAQTQLDLRVVDYRAEIDREYRDLKAQARTLGLVGPEATPRELAASLEGPADELAEMFERFDYSPTPVTREDYEAFMQAKEACRPDGG